MAKTTHGIRRFKVRYLIPDEESFKKIGFGFSKVDDGYEVYSLPSNWTKKRERPLRYIVEDDKGRFRATIGLSPDEPENSYIMLKILEAKFMLLSRVYQRRNFWRLSTL